MTTDIYKQAIDVQYACNPRGVLHSFYTDIMPAIVAETNGSTDDICRHPAFVLFADKLRSLAQSDYFDAYEAASRRIQNA